MKEGRFRLSRPMFDKVVSRSEHKSKVFPENTENSPFCSI